MSDGKPIITLAPDGRATTLLTILNKKGLHARAAAKFVNVVNGFNAEVQVQRQNCPNMLFEDQDYWTANGASVLGILTLGAEKGCQLYLEAKGADAAAVLEALADLLERKFDEGE